MNPAHVPAKIPLRIEKPLYPNTKYNAVTAAVTKTNGPVKAITSQKYLRCQILIKAPICFTLLTGILCHDAGGARSRYFIEIQHGRMGSEWIIFRGNRLGDGTDTLRKSFSVLIAR